MRDRLIIMRMSLCAKKLPAPAKSKPRSLVQHRSKLGFGDGTLDCSAFKEKSYWAHSSAAEPHCSHAYRPIDWNRRGNERRLLPASRQETRAAQESPITSLAPGLILLNLSLRCCPEDSAVAGSAHVSSPRTTETVSSFW